MAKIGEHDPAIEAALHTLEESGRYQVKKIANYKKHSFQVDKSLFVVFYQTIREVKSLLPEFTITDAVNEAFQLWIERRRQWLEDRKDVRSSSAK